MKRRRFIPIFILVFVALVTVPLMACLGTPAKPSTPTTSVATQIAELQTNKASKSDVYLKTETYTREEIDNKVAAAGSSTDAYPKTETYTRAEIENLIQSAVDDLEEQIDNIDTGSSGSGSSSNNDDEYGDIVDTDGALELWVERTSPASDPFRLSSGLDEVEFDIVVVNTDDDDTHRFDLSLRISPEDDVGLNGAHIDCYPDVGIWTVTRSGMGDIDQDPLYADNDSEIWIDKGDKDSYTVVFVVDSKAAEYWDWKMWIEETH